MAHMSRSVITSCRSIGGGLAGARAAFRSPAFSTNANPLGNGRDIPVLRRRFSSISRLPVELACCVESLIPLHSAVASSRLTSRLSINSRSLAQEILAHILRCWKGQIRTTVWIFWARKSMQIFGTVFGVVRWR